MGTITAQSIIDRAERQLLDETNVRWSATELLAHLNSMMREAVAVKPSAYSVNTTLQCVAGTRQSLPAEAVRLLDVIRNLGTDGLTPGRAITKILRSDLDHTDPEWHTASETGSMQHWMFDPDDPKGFWNYPPQPDVSPSQIQVLYSKTPPEVALGDAIPLDDIYEPTLFYGVMARAHSKETEHAIPERAREYYRLFYATLTGKAQAEVLADANVGE